MVDIEKIKTEYTDLTSKIQDPALSKDPDQFREVSIRLSEVTEIVDLNAELEKTQKQLDEAHELAGSDDSEIKSMAEEEIIELVQKVETLRLKIDELAIEKDPNDTRNAIIEIRAGTGGDEAALFAGDLFRMYSRYAERKGWKVEIYNSHSTGNGGFKEVIAMISGKNVFGELKFESGVHRVQRIPVTESAGRIHTSAASVVVLPEIEDVEIEVKDDDIRIDVFRAGGPGGQSVNTTDSAVRITYLPTGMMVSVQDEKSQLKNKVKAMKILKSRLYELKLQEEQEKASESRQAAIKGGDRSAKIRTYNFPQSRITDHRIKKSWYNMQTILDGDLEEMIRTVKVELSNE